jgi:hypothetical protein
MLQGLMALAVVRQAIPWMLATAGDRYRRSVVFTERQTFNLLRESNPRFYWCD